MKVAMVFGASRGIGADVALRLSDDYLVVVLSKTTKDSINASTGSIDSVLKQIQDKGNKGHKIQCDVTNTESIKSAVRETLNIYKKIDLVIYNAGAIDWNPVKDTPLKKFDLMHNINTRGLYILIQEIIPTFNSQKQGEIIVVSPPIYTRFIRKKTPYAITKLSATILVLGLAMELPGYIRINTLWPATAIKSLVTTLKNIDDDLLRHPRIFSDAILEITKGDFTGRCLIDQDFLAERGVKDFEKYRCGEKEPPRMMPRDFPSLLVKEQDDRGFMGKL
jgi:NAD(P)-dependent dehydrogenase (short-subunit alcohol dehydrogenase family)